MKQFKDSRIGLRSVFLLTVILLSYAGLASAQSNGIPGIWKRVIIPPRAQPDDISFIDSLNGVGFGGSFITTSNGGKSWNVVDSSPIFDGWSPPFLHAVSCTGPSQAIVAKSNCDHLELDGDSVYQADCSEDAPPFFFTYTPLAQKMYDSLYGFRFVQVLERGSILDMTYIAVTHDGWATYAAYGDSLIGTELSTNENGGESEIDGVTIVDSNEVWVGVNNTIYRTTNAGVTWDTIYPLAGTADSNVNPKWYNFIINQASKEVYAKSYPPPIDYAYSSDYGKTWQLDSVFKGHIVRLAVPAPHTLWAVLCPSAFSNPNAGPPYSLVDPSPSFWCRSLAYSSDNGSTWSVDSTTFKAEDSVIIEMNWLDARHAWIVAINAIPYPYTDSDNMNSIWYYDADGNSDVQTSVVGIKYGTIRVYPDPATNIIYTDVTDDTLQIYDPLGRKYPVTMTGDAIDVSRLSSGVYFLYDGIAVRAKFLKE
jgi:hypothetical protein